MLTHPTRLQNKSFHVPDKTRTKLNAQKENKSVQSVQNYCFSVFNVLEADIVVEVPA